MVGPPSPSAPVPDPGVPRAAEPSRTGLPAPPGEAAGASRPSRGARLRDLLTAGAALSGAGALYAGLLFVASLGVGEERLARAETEATAFLWMQALDDALLAGTAALFGRGWYPGSWRGLGVRAAGWRWVAIGAGAGVGAAALAWAVSLALQAAGRPAPAHPVETLLAHARGPADFGLILLAVTVPVALGEELFFRGFAYRLLRARLGVLGGVGASALLFALVHGTEAAAWLPVLPVGVVLALLTERSGSLVPAVTAHAVVNAVAVLLEAASGPALHVGGLGSVGGDIWYFFLGRARPVWY